MIKNNLVITHEKDKRAIYNDITPKEKEIIYQVAVRVREYLEKNYGEHLYGKCIEASDLIIAGLKKKGIKATTHQGYCLYELYENCTDVPYADHVYTLYRKGNQLLYIDITLDQFQSQFTRNIPKIVILDYIPNFILKRKPGRDTILHECGWTDYYEGYNYINNFNYYGKGRTQL
jgi:hypothetical protein